MAGNALIGALRVSLGLDSAQFAKGAKGAQRQADTMASSIVKSLKGATVAFAAVGAAATAMAAAVAVPVKRSIDAMDELVKSAQKVGTTAQELQKLRYAADLSGVSNEKLTVGLTKLNIALSKVGQDGGNAASKALERLGVKSGTSTLEAVQKLAAQFQAMPDGVRKSALAVEIFGRSGAELIPLLNSGADGIAALASEAERFGIVTDTKTLKAAEQFNDNLTRLKRASEGVVTQFTAGLLPTLASVTDAMLANVATGPRWVEFGKSVGAGLVNIAEAAFVVYEALSGVVKAHWSLVAAMEALTKGKGFSAAWKIVTDQNDATSSSIERRRKLFQDLRRSIAEFQPGERAGGPGGAGETAGFMAGPLKAAREIKDIYNGLTSSQVRMGGLDRLQDVLGRDGGVSEGMSGTLDSIKGMGDTLANAVLPSFEGLAQTIPQIKDPMLGPFQAATRFGENLARSLGQALVFGQSLGDALKSSIRAAAAELVTSGLLNLLLGERGGGGVRSGGLLGSVIGGVGKLLGLANGTPSAPGGLALVGERGQELVNMPGRAKVWSNAETERMLKGGGDGGQQRVVVDVQPSPLFLTTVRQATEQTSAATVAAAMKANRRMGLAGAF